MIEKLSTYPVQIEISVAWGEMDAFNHVNNIVYFRYFESARITYFERIDYLQKMEETGIGPILASTQCKFKRPLSYPDKVTVGAKISNIEEDRFVMEYAVYGHKLRNIVAEGQGLVVSYNYREMTTVPLDEEIKQSILKLENSINAK